LAEIKDNDLITLKEAAEISGYAPDYVGQLIRKGKIYGKQVYFNVAWMTTREAVLSYIEKSGEKKDNSLESSNWLQRLINYLDSDQRLTYLAKLTLYGIAAISIAFCLFLFFVFASSWERNANQEAFQKAAGTASFEQW
jgi:hypothetical protein